MKSKEFQKWMGVGLTATALLLAGYVTFIKTTRGGLEIERNGGAAVSSEMPIPEEMKALTDLYRVINLVQQRYIDASRINPREMFVGAMRAVQISLARAMVSQDAGVLELKMGDASRRFKLSEITTPWILLQRMKDAFSFIRAEAVDNPDMQKMEYDAINGMLKTLDPHSIFLNPDQYREMQDKTHGNFAGLGIVISIRDGDLTIISPIDGTPADAAGLAAGDRIVKIDEESTVNMPLNDAVDLLRGEPGTAVTVYILRKGWDVPKPFRVVRALVKVESLETHLLEGRVGYVRIKDFQGNTAQDIMSTLAEWRRKSLKGLVLDLRGCPGGLLEAAVAVSDLFLKRGVIVTTAGQDPGERDIRRAEDSGMEPEYPIVVVVDQGSASASEILAGALKNNGRALVIGEQTFGKGSVQVLFEFQDEHIPGATTALKLTTAQYLTPGDVSIQSVGVMPHVEVRPMRADDEVLDLKVDGGYRESDLSHHFETAGNAARADRSLAQLSYLWTPPPRPEGAGDGEGDTDELTPIPLPEKDEPFEPDYMARLAADLAAELALQKEGDIAAAVAGLSDFFQERQRREEKRLAAALKKLSVDWQAAPSAKETANATVSLSVNGDATVSAGKEHVVSVTVTNNGPGTLYRLFAESRSDFRPLDDRELAFGKIAPGASVTRRYTFRVPKDALAEIDDVRWSFDAEGAEPPKPVAVRFETVPLPRPHFGYTWVIDDTEGGNGDGRIQPGESIQLKVSVHNLGEGPSLNTYATLKSIAQKQVFLISGRENLEVIEPNDRKEAIFSFEVKPGFTESSAGFELAFADVDLREYLVEKLALPVAQGGKPVPPSTGPSRINSAPMLEIEPPSLVTQSAEIRVRGRAHDESVVRDLYVFVDNDKRYFVANSDPDSPNSMVFDALLPLKKGLNYITVVVEEDGDLETREIIAVRRDGAGRMPYLLSRSLGIDDEAEPLGVLPVNLDTIVSTRAPHDQNTVLE